MEHGTALEALARRRLRWDISKTFTQMASDLTADSMCGDIPAQLDATFRTSDGSAAAKTAGGKLHGAGRFDTNRELASYRDNIARELSAAK
jgi:hypothetical protein